MGWFGCLRYRNVQCLSVAWSRAHPMVPSICSTVLASTLAWCQISPPSLRHALGSSLSSFFNQQLLGGELTGPASSRLHLRAESVKVACCRAAVCDVSRVCWSVRDGVVAEQASSGEGFVVSKWWTKSRIGGSRRRSASRLTILSTSFVHSSTAHMFL